MSLVTPPNEVSVTSPNTLSPPPVAPRGVKVSRGMSSAGGGPGATLSGRANHFPRDDLHTTWCSYIEDQLPEFIILS